MSMLAEPRRKQKIFNLRAKNNAWSNDADKFGQKMLEKMGWSAGKGLGAKEDGIVEHVLARYKNDSAGLGFEDKNDQWTRNEQDFEGLLKSLSGVNDSNDGKLNQIVSLEEKSKRSRSRIHYHKSTRGKDLSKYSEKDLANIFGKKTLSEKPKKVVEVVLTEEKSAVTGQLFTTKGTLVDYFKQIKSKDCVDLNEDLHENEYNDIDSRFKGFSQTNTDNSTNLNNSEIIHSNEFTKLSKRKKKRKIVDEANPNEHPNSNTNFTDVCVSEDVLHVKKKKNKKTKSIQSDITEPLEFSPADDNTEQSSSCLVETVLSKKKKNKKSKDIFNCKSSLQPEYYNEKEYSIDNEILTDNLIKKNKKKADGRITIVENIKKTKSINPLDVESISNEALESSAIDYKKFKKRKYEYKNNISEIVEDNCNDGSILKKVKHKRKAEINNSIENCDIATSVIDVKLKRKGKKEKNRV